MGEVGRRGVVVVDDKTNMFPVDQRWPSTRACIQNEDVVGLAGSHTMSLQLAMHVATLAEEMNMDTLGRDSQQHQSVTQDCSGR